MKYKLIIGALLLALGGVGATGTALATGEDAGGTFTVAETDDTVELRFGSNWLLVGNGIISNKSAAGLLLSAGNDLKLNTKSEYGFATGNFIQYDATTTKDLFVAGNIITVGNEAKIGRDTFIAGNNVRVEADLPGNLSVTANKLILNNNKVDGDVNLSVNELVIEEQTVITGKLIVNTDAHIDGIEKLTYREIEKYEIVEYSITAVDFWMAKIFSIAALFIAFAIIMALFPGVGKRVNKELSVTQFGKDVLIGLVTLVLVPVIIVFLLLSFVGAPAAILLLCAYLVMIYVAQGYSGLWLGKVIVEKLAHGKINAFVEMLIGITVLGLLAMIPWVGSYIGLLSLLLGLGLFMQSIKPNRQKKPLVVSRTEETIEEAETVTEPEPKASATSKSSKKSDTKDPNSKKSTVEEKD